MASSVTPTRLLESPSDVRAEIDRRLAEDGLGPQSTDEEKLFFVWKLYQIAENDLQTATENEEKLRRAQTEEMQEVENYVEHIRHLSDEREALIQELETENDQLKQDIERMRLDQSASALRDETAEMLTQQGLEEIAQAPTSEQIAFLLVERARLLDELEAEQVRSMSASDGRISEDLQRTLDKEREELEEEMETTKERHKSEIEQVRREHDEEITVLMDENQQLEDDLAISKEKVQNLESRLKEVEDELKREKESHDKDREGFVSPDPRASPRQRPPSPARSPNDVALRQIIAEKTKIEGEILGYKSQIRTMENENTNLREKLSKMEKEHEQTQMVNSQLQVKNKSLKTELDEMEQQLDDSEAQIDDLRKERDSLKDTLENVTSEFSTLQSQTQKSGNLADTVDRLNRENKELTIQIETLKHEMDEVVAEKDQLVSQKLELSKGEIELTSEIQNLKQELNQVKQAKEEYNVNRSELEHTQTLLNTKSLELEKLNTDTEQLNKTNKELLNRLETVQSELDTVKSDTQGAAKQELIMGHLREQNSKLSKEVEELKSQLKEKQEELEQNVSKHKKEIDDIKAKLQLALKELSKAKSVVEQERSENSELTARIMELEQILEENSRAEDSKASNLSENLECKVKELEKLVAEKLAIEDELEEQKMRTTQLQGDLEELEATKIELEDSRDLLDQEKHSRTQMEIRLREMEHVLDDQKLEHDNIQQSLTAKVKSLENRVQALQDDLFAAQDELQDAQETHEKIVQQSQNDLKTARSDLQKVKAEKVDLQEKLSQEEQKSSLQAQKQKEESNLVVQRLENQKIENYEKQIEAMKARLSDAQKQTDSVTRERDTLNREIKLLRETAKQFTSQTEDSDNMRKEMESLKRELEHLRTSAEYEGQERQQHLDKIRTLEDYTRQVELDNRELANKLSETLVKYEQSEEALEKEKKGTVNRQQQSSRHLSQVESDLETANKKVRELRDDLQKKQNQLMKIEADRVGQSAKSESSIARLEAELNELKMYHRKELEKLTSKSEQATKDAKELRNQLREKDQEILSKQHEGKRIKAQCDRLEAQLQTEVKIRTDLENRNTALDQEISKVWGQVRQLMEKNASLETTKRNLEDELERKNTSVRQAETTYAQSKASHETTSKALFARTEAAEKRADNLQRELQEVSVKLQAVQSQVYQAENCKVDLQDKRDRVTSLKNQLDGEKLQRSLLDQTVKELQQQVTMMRQREEKVLEKNRELQHTILDLESKLEEMHDRSQTAFEMQQHMSEVGKRSMMEQILKLQTDIKDLQYELLTVNERKETIDRRYEERKVRTKAKLLKASDDEAQCGMCRLQKEYYTKEKVRVQDQLHKMDEDLRLTRATLRKELDWKERMDTNYKQLLSEKRELLSQLSEIEENLREKVRMVSILQVRTKFLEEENSRLQDRIDAITHQKHGLDKLLKDQNLGKEREPSSLRPMSPSDNAQTLTVATSGLGNSVNSSWDHDHLVDAIMNYRTQSSDTGLNSFLGPSFAGGGSIDLYRGETGSESSFTQDDDA